MRFNAQVGAGAGELSGVNSAVPTGGLSGAPYAGPSASGGLFGGGLTARPSTNPFQRARRPGARESTAAE